MGKWTWIYFVFLSLLVTPFLAVFAFLCPCDRRETDLVRTDAPARA